MAVTYESIASSTISTDTSSFTFSSIPSTYTDLIIYVTGTSTQADNVGLRFNGDSNSNYSQTYLSNNVSGRDITATKSRGGILEVTDIGSNIIHIFQYSNTSIYKTIFIVGGTPSWAMSAWSSLWRSTNAITSITIFPQSVGVLKAGTTLSIYGIKAA